MRLYWKLKMIKLYDEVFDLDGNIRLCGREKCKELIHACYEVNHTIDFGNKETGVMNIKNIKDFVKGTKANENY